ncbi:MAG: FtsB family cell division protein [Chloroflexota bacterium]
MSEQPPIKRTNSKEKYPTKKPDTNSKRTGQLSGLQIMFAAILAIGLILAINFSARIASSRLQRTVFDRVQSEVSTLDSERATLVAELDFVQSDAFVEQWARGDGKMIRPGEILVVPLSPGNIAVPTPTPPLIVDVETAPPEPDTWTLWWSLFFDSAPPGN